jgi:transposase
MLTLNRKEQRRLRILNEVEGERLSMSEASELMALSLRQVRRLRTAYRDEGVGGLAHGNRGRPSSNALDVQTAERVVALARQQYRGVNQQHLTELLEEEQQIHLSRSTVRRILLCAGIRSPQRRRAPRHRRRRERKPREGMLLQIDGSPHAWLGEQGPRLCLVGAIDDATNQVPYAVFRRQEDLQGYFTLLRHIVRTKGIPLALYHDRHTIFVSPRKEEESIHAQLEGKRSLTQMGRALDELGITSIPADSPEAKGRIERLWRTFQDRLVSELRLADARDLDAANRVLRRFLPRYNSRFVLPAAEPGSAYRTPDPDLNLSTILCLKHMRTVGSDNVVRFKRRRLQLLPSHGRRSYARARVEVHEQMNGSIAVYHNGSRINTTPAPLEAPALRQSPTPSAQPPVPPTRPAPTHRKPAPDHPWRRPFIPKRTGRTFSLTT